MSEIKEELVFTIKKRPDWLILFMTGAWTIVAPIMTIYFLFLFYTDHKPTPNFEQIVFPIFVIIGEIFTIKTFLWHYRGQEKVTMTKELFRIEKIGSILNFPGKYNLEKIKNFSLAEKKFADNMTDSFKLSGGKIQFLYYGEVIKFGQTLKLEEAKEIIKKLNNQINNEPLTNAIANAGMRVR